MSNYRRTIVIYCCLLLITAVAGGGLWKKSQPKEITRQELQQWMQEGTIAEAEVNPTPYSQAGIFSVTGKQVAGEKTTKFEIVTHLDETQIKALLATPAVKIEIPGKGTAQVMNILPPVLIAGLIVFVLYSQFNVGKSKKHHKVETRPDVTFADVAGVEEAKSEVQEIVDFLKNPKKYKKLGGKLPKGILLIGPPGTGKTMLAKAIAGEADAQFFSAHGSDFNEVFVGVGAKRIREIFRQAKKNKPAIIFIDEVDCLGKKRKMDGHGELQQTNNALLAEMDGFESSDGIVVVAATNRPEDLDDALMRQGRFDRKVYVALPDRKGRRAILEVHTKEKPIREREKALDVLAQTTCEMSGADLASLINEAAILCAQRNFSEIPLKELEEARDKVRWGKERKSMVLKKGEREMVAYHEAGHTIINLQKSLLPPLYKVSIIPRGAALGVTTLLPIEDQNIHSKDFLLEELVVLMGGRAAEKVFYGATTNGASGDLDTARKIAQKMIHEWGMGEKLYYQPDQREAEVEINKILEAADKEAHDLIKTLKEDTRKLAEALLKCETLTREQVVNLLYENVEPSVEPNCAFS
jgi:cell division protease FtsH